MEFVRKAPGACQSLNDKGLITNHLGELLFALLVQIIIGFIYPKIGRRGRYHFSFAKFRVRKDNNATGAIASPAANTNLSNLFPNQLRCVASCVIFQEAKDREIHIIRLSFETIVNRK